MKPSSTQNQVSLIVVNHNAGQFLSDCIASTLDQVAEAIIVDNASSDDSISRLLNRFPDNDKLRIIRNSSNVGFAAACNIGTETATMHYLLFLNPDCIAEPNTVSYLSKALTSYPGAELAGGLLINPDGTEQAGGRRAVPTPWRSFVRAFGLSRYSDRWPRLLQDFSLENQPLPSEPVEVEAISGACVLIAHDTLNKIGAWDENYFLHCEDLDLCMRTRRHGGKVLFVPDAKIIHHQGSCSRSRLIYVEWHKHRGMLRFYRKFFKHQYPWGLVWLVTLGVWFRFSAIAIYYTLQDLKKILGSGHG